MILYIVFYIQYFIKIPQFKCSLGVATPPHAVKRFCVNCSNIKILVNKQARKINEHKIIIPCNTPEGKRYREVPSY